MVWEITHKPRQKKKKGKTEKAKLDSIKTEVDNRISSV